MLMIELTGAQQDRITALLARHAATSHTVETDEPHDTHVFVSFYAAGRFLSEHIIDADGTCCDEQCE